MEAAVEVLGCSDARPGEPAPELRLNRGRNRERRARREQQDQSAPGSATIEGPDAERLREYLLKGGMLWTDDSWGSYQWQHWMGQLRKVLPAAEYPIFDVPLDHPLFKTQFEVLEIPQIPNIGFFLRSGGGTSEQGADSAVPYVRGIADSSGRLMVLMTHNTDIQDSWEREGDDPSYFYAFSPRGYAFGINAIMYALTH